MSTTFVVSDTHFKTTCVDDTYEYIDRWNQLITPEDTVIHLGDVAWNEKGLEFVQALHGHKILVMGNHDTLPMRRYKQYFDDIYRYYLYEDILFSHAPLCPLWAENHYTGQKQHSVLWWTRYYMTHHTVRYNIHGHFHTYGKSKFIRTYQGMSRPSKVYNKKMHLSVPYHMFTIGREPIQLNTVLQNIELHPVNTF